MKTSVLLTCLMALGAFAELAEKLTRAGLQVEGIGSRTKPYFWINAFIREFVATLQAEKKRHAVAFAAMILWCVLMIVMLYISNVVLS